MPQIVHRHGLLPLCRPGRHRAQRLREPRLVHLLHALPGRDLAGPSRGAAELPDRRDLAHGHGDRQLLAPGRGHGHRRSHADDVRAALARSGQGRSQPALRRPQHLPADARRAAHAQRTVRHRTDRRRIRRIQLHGQGVRRHRPVPGRQRRRARLYGLHGRSTCQGRAGHGCRRPAFAGAAQIPRRVGRRHRRRLDATPGHPDGLRRPRRRLHGHARGLQAQHARPHHRRLGRPPRQQGAAHGAPDARTAYQARTRHVEHLHRLGADGLDGRLLLRLQRPRGAETRCRHGPPGRRNGRRRTPGDGLQTRRRRLLRHARSLGRSRRRAVAGTRKRHQLLLPHRRLRAHVVRRGDHPRRGRRGNTHLRHRQRQESQGRKARHRKPRAGRPAPPHGLSLGGGLQHLPLGKRPDALHQEARTEGHLARQFDDLFRFVHHEAQRRGAHAAALAGGLPDDAPLRPGRPGRRLHAVNQGVGKRPGDDHGLRGLLPATQFGRCGRIRRADGDPRLPPEPRTGLPQRGADPGLGPRHQPRVGRHGRHEDRHGSL